MITPAPAPDLPRDLAPWRQELDLFPADLDRGLREIYDAARLPNGRLLVALGEAGVEVLTRDGRRAALLDHPAHRLVVAHHGTRALALARRGEDWKIARLDLAALRAAAWCDLRIDAFADSYDGDLWFVSVDGGIQAIDCRSEKGTESLWQIPELPGMVIAISCTPASCEFVVDGPLRQCWRLALPELTLRARDDLPLEAGYAIGAAVGPTGYVALAVNDVLEDEPVASHGFTVAVFHDGRRLRTLTLPEQEAPHYLGFLGEDRLLAVQSAPDGLHLSRGRVQGGFESWGSLGGARWVTARFTVGYLALGDDRGRLLVHDLRDEERVVDLRL